MRYRAIIVLALCCSAATAAAGPAPLVIEPGADLYPADALSQALEGDVAVTLTVSPSGDLRCSPSADPLLSPLRKPSCTLIVERYVFGLKTVNGAPQAESYSLIVRWRKKSDISQFGGAIPIGRARWISYADYPGIARQQMLTGRVSVGFDINEFGRIERCKVIRTSATETLAGAICPLLAARAIFLPALDAGKRPQATKGRFNTDWRWCPDSSGKGCKPPDTGA